MLREKLSPWRSPVVLVVGLLAVLILVLILSKRFLFIPKILIILLVILAVTAMGKLKVFVQDWFVFIGFIYLFDSFRGSIYFATCRFGLPVHTLYVIRIEQFLFGGIPSVMLQNLFLHPGATSGFGWLEKLITVAHGSHFVAFLLVGFIIWFYRPRYFRFFKISFYLTIFLGLLGYFAVPTVPPWMASNVFGLLPRIVRFNAIIYNLAIPDITSGFDTNPVAAMPSLHAAFPFLCALILWRIYRFKAWPFYLYAVLMQFAIVYTGDHYVTDALAGFVLAGFCYGAALFLTQKDTRAEKTVAVGKPEAAGTPRKLVGALAGGILILFSGIAIGSYNRDQFLHNPTAYGLYVPRYVDFFRHESDYATNFQVQYYLGSHHFLKREFDQAIAYFEKCLAMARNEAERQRAETGIRMSREYKGAGGARPDRNR
jgi:membrane-associated phospholipid phosphatase